MNLQKYLDAAGVPPTLHEQALESLERSRQASKQVTPYKLSAPLVMAWVVPRLPWEAENLPAKYAKWDNDISINGDPWGWAQRPDGSWYRPAPLEDTPEAREKCYWAKGHHPRSKWARYVWLGWRNKASKLAHDLGEPMGAPISTWGDEEVSRANPGVCVYRMGECWQIMSVERKTLAVRLPKKWWDPWAGEWVMHVWLDLVIRRNVGWKINNILHNQHTTANLTWLPWSLLKRKATDAA